MLGQVIGSATATGIEELMDDAWVLAALRIDATADWMGTGYGSPGMFTRYPTVANTATGKWSVTANNGDWRAGFWPGTLWMLAQKTGENSWRLRATEWSQSLAATANGDHDIGFILLGSMGKGWYFHDDLSDPGGTYREFARNAITVGAGKLGARFNKPIVPGLPIPVGMIRSWNDPFQSPYPVCIDNLMNLELLLMAYEMNGRLPEQRPWFDHALVHARTSIARHLRADGGSYHVVRHFEAAPHLGGIERKNTLQGYGDETTWARGQAWALYGLSAVYRYARRDPGTDASDILAAARAVADYFIAHLPHHRVSDPYNHRIGDHVPPKDFNAALGEPAGPWNDANDDYNPSSGIGLGDRMPATLAFTPRDSSAAAIAAAGLIELAGFMRVSADRTRYLDAAEDILKCLISYDGPDVGSDADYLCVVGDPANPGILKEGNARWTETNRSLSYGDYYFLEAMTRLEALKARELLATTQRIHLANGVVGLEFERPDPAPALSYRIEKSTNLAQWNIVAAKSGGAPWTGAVEETQLPGGVVRVRLESAASASREFFRVLTRSVDGSAP
jgi:hypothetical protein